jgi:hypothetical protein
MVSLLLLVGGVAVYLSELVVTQVVQEELLVVIV